MFKVETLEAGARERQECSGMFRMQIWMQSRLLLSQVGWHVGCAVGNMRAVFISWLHERACLYVCNQQKGKGVAGLDH